MGIQCVDSEAVTNIVSQLHCPQDGQAVAAERMLLNRLDGGCQLPFGVNIRREGETWQLEAFLANSPTDPAPLRFDLKGNDANEVAELAWTRIQEFKSGKN